jgi:putative ABC transport system permease protein
VLLSASSPIRATMKLPMIEAVRGNAIYRGSQVRKNKKGRFLKKLFGFPGLLAAKNIRRNPKQFRTTLISVVVSVILFLSVGGFSMAVNASIKQGINTTGGMDYTFRVDRRDEKEVKKLDSLETKVKSQPMVANAQKTPVYGDVNLNIPAERIPDKYFSVYKEFKGNESAHLLSTDDAGNKYLFCGINVIEVSRENYGSLKFAGKAPSYDELLSSKGALLCQTKTFVSSGGRIATADFAAYKIGETIPVFQNYQLKKSGNDQAPGAKERKLNVRIMGILSEAPWYALDADGYLVVAQGNSSLFDTSGLSGASPDQGNSTVLQVRYRKGAEQEADASMAKLAAATKDVGISSCSVYQVNRASRNSFLVMEIFVVGFTVVIILISCVNVFNTIHANFQTRRREIAMTRAVGMDRRQLYQMLLLECSLYGLTGTFWGSIIGLSLQFLLLHAFGHIILADMQSPLLLVLISLAVSVGLGILAGWSSIRKMVKAPLVEEIRSEE